MTLTAIPDARVFFCGSGSEAIDTAMKLARLAHVMAGHPERTLIISRARGYHGTNFGGTSAQGIAPNREGWGPLVGDVVQVPGDDVEALSVLMTERGHEVAAVLTEPVQGAGGVFPPAGGIPRRRPPAVRPARRVADLRRGDHRIRTARHVVRRPSLRRHARPDDVRQGRDVGLPATRRRVRRRRRAPGARVRSGVPPPPRLHVLGSPVGVRRRRRQPRHHRARGADRRGQAGRAPDSATGSRRWPPTA